MFVECIEALPEARKLLFYGVRICHTLESFLMRVSESVCVVVYERMERKEERRNSETQHTLSYNNTHTPQPNMACFRKTSGGE